MTGLYRSRPVRTGLAGAILAAWLLFACATPATIRPENGSSLVLMVLRQSDRKVLMLLDVEPGAQLVFAWRHSVEHFLWLEHFEIAADGRLILREMQVQGYGAGVPHNRGQTHRTADGWIISSGIDEDMPAYAWLNSHTAVASVTLNDRLLFSGSDFPHHEALELRVGPRRLP